MGVPLLFKYITRICPQCVQTHTKCPATHLYIDFNAVVHECARMKTVHDEEQVIGASIERVHNLIETFLPVSDERRLGKVFIALDGVPPRAKMVQQRSRRYLSNQRTPDVPEWWDSCIVTPGTKFMRRLSLALYNELWSVEVNISDASDVGEGEQKIFKLMRSEPPSKDSHDVICGLDADLIVMAMGATLDGRRISIARETNVVVDINEICDCIHEKLMKMETRIQSIRNFVVMISLVGNDFIPNLPGLTLNDHGIERLCVTLGRHKNVLVGEESADIDIHTLHSVLLDISRKEASMIHIIEARTQEMNPIRPLDGGWHPRYNQRVFGQSNPEAIQEICTDYISGVIWNARYMLDQRCISDGFAYVWHHAPTAHDLAMILAQRDVMDRVDKRLKEMDEADRDHRRLCRATMEGWHLCHVLPRQRAYLLDEASQPAIRRVMTQTQFGATHFFPTGFKTTSYLVQSSHMKNPILPVFDDCILSNAIRVSNASDER